MADRPGTLCRGLTRSLTTQVDYPNQAEAPSELKQMLHKRGMPCQRAF